MRIFRAKRRHDVFGALMAEAFEPARKPSPTVDRAAKQLVNAR